MNWLSPPKKEEKIHMLSKETKVVPMECSKLNVGDIILAATLGDTIVVSDVEVGNDITKLRYGGMELFEEFNNRHRLYVIVKNSLN